MAFRVEIEPQAFEDLDAIAEYIKSSSSFAIAERWFNGVIDSIASLKDMPSRCPIAPEAEDLGEEVRILLHGRRNRTYKIYFVIHNELAGTGEVQVFHVRHWARQAVKSNELQKLMDEIGDEQVEE